MNKTLTAKPYEARQCPRCGEWIFTDAPPFGENDPTKTQRDWIHWEREHDGDVTDALTIGFPYFPHNETTVQAILETL